MCNMHYALSSLPMGALVHVPLSRFRIHFSELSRIIKAIHHNNDEQTDRLQRQT